MEHVVVDTQVSRRNYPRIQKNRLLRDVVKHKNHSRFVIILDDENKASLIENQPAEGMSREIIPLIVVIGSGEYLGQNISETILLEIGLKRTRPYRPTLSGTFSREREPVCDINPEQQQAAFPIILECLEKHLLETRARWTAKSSRWFVSFGAYQVEKGVQISVHKRDRWLYRECLFQHMRYFQSIHLPKFAKWIKDRLRTSKFNRYSPRQYGPKARQVGEEIRRSRYFNEPLLLETLMQMSGRADLIRSILSDLHNHIHTLDEETELVYIDPHVSFPQKNYLWFYKTLDQPAENGFKSQAKGCARFEVIPETSWISKIESRIHIHFPSEFSAEEFREQMRRGFENEEDCPF